MIASFKCSSQTIPTDTTVLKHLYKEAASAYYLRIDTTLRAKETKLKDSLLLTKDSQLKNEVQKFEVCEFEKNVLKSDVAICKSNNKKLNRKVAIYKTTTIAGCFTFLILFIKTLL